MSVYSAVLDIDTHDRTEMRDITMSVAEVVSLAGVASGIVFANALHTTCALLVNEYQHSLVGDIRALAGRLVPSGAGYQHDDARYSDCERGNADSHLRTALFGRSIAVGVDDGGLVLGRFQSIIFAEFDGPRARRVSVQVLGR